MDSSATADTRGKSVLHIGGIPVEFPYNPYGSQLAFMGRVISTLDRASKEGRSHALLESPTGTGKTLSLLCSVLAWQRHHSKNPSSSNHLVHGGGFLPETQNQTQSTSDSNSKHRKKTIPTVFYASRTHSQISQVVSEYRKTDYRVPMAVLASRRHYCTNTVVRGRNDINDECKSLLKNRNDNRCGCAEFKNSHKVKAHPSLQIGGCHQVHDVEDLLKIGQMVRGCSYFAARSMSEDANLVFCPYNYIINPIIRGAMNIDITGSIVILDEAHNIEDMARVAGSVDIEEDNLQKLGMELGFLSSIDALVYQPLYEVVDEIMDWMRRRKSGLEKHQFHHYVSSWSGEKAAKELEEAGILQNCFPLLQACAKKAIKSSTDADSSNFLTGSSLITLEGLFSSLAYFFSENGVHVVDYQLVLQHFVKNDGGWTYNFSLWCLNPAVVFRGIADQTFSVILTSGTLSPISSFSGELGVHFATCLEAPHVINTDMQLWAATVSTCPDLLPLNASHKSSEGYTIQDSFGRSLEEIFKVVPEGCLVFFPSYKLMEKLCTRWEETGQWARMSEQKTLFVEPRGGGGGQDDFECVLKGYYECIKKSGKQKVNTGGMRRLKKTRLSPWVGSKDGMHRGGAFLAVCRGKVSEGIDFSGENARAVIIIGIPFPNILDIQVTQKKKYNDRYKSSKSLLSGSEWYCHEAFRAVNQAIGRCIRHKDDYGAILLLDERFRDDRNIAYMSKWMKKSIKQHQNFEYSVQELKCFFKEAKEFVNIKTVNEPHKSVICDGNTASKIAKRRVNANGAAMEAETNSASSSGSMQKTHGVQIQGRGDITESSTCREYINNLEAECEKDEEVSWQSLEETIVDETPESSINESDDFRETLGRDCSSISVIDGAGVEIYDHDPSVSFTHNNGKFSRPGHGKPTTPDNNPPAIEMSESGSCLNQSVDSSSHKRRSFTGGVMVSPIIGLDDVNGGGGGSEIKAKSARMDIPVAPSTFPGSVEQRKLHLLCSQCMSPLGLPENEHFIKCSVTSLSKVYLKSLLRNECLDSKNGDASTNIPVIISESSSVIEPLIRRSTESGKENGVWCQEDGCVFSNVFCPFCKSGFHCLGAFVMATDSANLGLLNKVLFCVERVHIKRPQRSVSGDDLCLLEDPSLIRRKSFLNF